MSCDQSESSQSDETTSDTQTEDDVDECGVGAGPCDKKCPCQKICIIFPEAQPLTL